MYVVKSKPFDLWLVLVRLVFEVTEIQLRLALFIKYLCPTMSQSILLV